MAFFPNDHATISSSAALPIRFPRHADTHVRGRVGQSRRLAELPDPEPGARPCYPSSRVTFRALSSRLAAANASACRTSSGSNSDSSGRGRPGRDTVPRLHHSTHRQPHATDARLAVHLVRVPRYAIKALHLSYSHTFWRPGALFRARQVAALHPPVQPRAGAPRRSAGRAPQAREPGYFAISPLRYDYDEARQRPSRAFWNRRIET